METKLFSIDRLTLLHPFGHFPVNCIFLSLKYNPRFNFISNIFLKYYKYFFFANIKGDDERRLEYKNSRIEAGLNLS